MLSSKQRIINWVYSLWLSFDKVDTKQNGRKSNDSLGKNPQDLIHTKGNFLSWRQKQNCCFMHYVHPMLSARLFFTISAYQYLNQVSKLKGRYNVVEAKHCHQQDFALTNLNNERNTPLCTPKNIIKLVNLFIHIWQGCQVTGWVNLITSSVQYYPGCNCKLWYQLQAKSRRLNEAKLRQWIGKN